MLMKMKKDLNNEEFNQYYVSKPIKKMLDKSKYHVLTKDWDRVFIIDGAEGTGKSLLGLQLGYYIDRTLNLDRVTFSGEDFTDAIKKAEKGQCIIFDEAFNGLSSGGAMSSMNKLIVRNLQECRQKNLFIIIILPTIFLLQKYVAIFRSQCLFHVYSTSKGERGYYRVYNRNNKKYLYLAGKKFYSYSKPFLRKSFIFRGKYPLNEQEYRKKKLESLKRESDYKNYLPGRQWQSQRDEIIYFAHFKWKKTYDEIENVFANIEDKIHKRQIGDICREKRQKAQIQSSTI